MENFTLHLPTKIIFGRETEKNVGEEVARYSRNILLHYGGGSIKRTGLYDKIVRSLEKHGIKFIELGGVVPNPRLSMVRKGIELCREEGIDFILAVGGGSVIDSAKAISAGVPYEGDVWDFFEKKAEPEKALPVATVLTISAAGSEMSNSMVITDEENERKMSCRSQLIRPVFSILNPMLTSTLPREQIAYGTADMFAHVVERYFTRTKDVDVTDEMCEAVMRSIIRNGKKAVSNSKDYDVLAELMLAGTIAHNGILGMGREEDWASHRIEHELSAVYDIAHGAGLAVIVPAWMTYVYKHDIERFARYARNVFHVIEENDEKAAVLGIEETSKFFSSLGLETTLDALRITDDNFGKMARNATEKGEPGKFVKLDSDDIEKIYMIALK